jgi:hypothetical protein
MQVHLEYLLIAIASVAAGAINALAGGGTLITFPMLTLVGIPALAANVTNTVALCPGYLGATIAQSHELLGQEEHLCWCLPAGLIGGVLGGVLLLHTGEHAFRAMVPFLILLASVLLAVQERLRAWLVRRAEHAGGRAASNKWAAGAVGVAAIYGGYFGAGLSVIVLATLGLTIDDSLTRLNALKQAIALCINVAAAVFFLFSGKVVWPAAIVMAAGALLGGVLGGRLAGRIQPAMLRRIVVAVGLVVAIIYLVR